MGSIIINVDRDNDFGEKVGIKGPILGYTECYNAAVKLISVDPEDSDANALFGALKHYDELQAKGEDIEICTITGDDDVGPKSDEIISNQLDQVLKEKSYQSAILISDGAEDDYIMPLILSRIPVRYVKHIIVRHNQNIESLYYYIVKALQDKKLVSKFIIPIGLLLLTYGLVELGAAIYLTAVGAIAGLNPSYYAGAIVDVVIGAYFVERGFDLRTVLSEMFDDIKKYSEEARILFISYLVSIGIVLVGIASSYVSITRSSGIAFDKFLEFLAYFSWWIYSAVFTREVLRAIDMYLGEQKDIQRIWYGLTFTLAAEFIVYGLLNYIRYVLSYVTVSTAFDGVVFMIMGIAVAIISALVHRHFLKTIDTRHFMRDQ